jgi:uncharacterized protein
MSESEGFTFVPEQFSGVARLFPLPNVVLFPHVMQPFHIFEPRYRDLMEESLESDRLIAMAILAPGWEKDYEARPAVGKVACLGRIATYQKQPEGRYNLLLLGVRRIEIVRELPPQKLFREAEVQILEDVYQQSGAAARPRLQRKLVQSFQKLMPQMTSSHPQLEQLLGSDVSLGMLTDFVAYTLDLNLRLKEQLLAETNVDNRAEILLEAIRELRTAPEESKRGFPPEFSEN